MIAYPSLQATASLPHFLWDVSAKRNLRAPGVGVADWKSVCRFGTLLFVSSGGETRFGRIRVQTVHPFHSERETLVIPSLFSLVNIHVLKLLQVGQSCTVPLLYSIDYGTPRRGTTNEQVSVSVLVELPSWVSRCGCCCWFLD